MPRLSESIDELIAGTPDWRGETVSRLRALIHEADPDIVEEVKWRRPANPLGAPVFEHDGIVCLIAVLKERVRLSFNEGAALPDPRHLFNAQLDGNKTRAIDIYEHDNLDEPGLKALVRAGVERNLAKERPSRGRK